MGIPRSSLGGGEDDLSIHIIVNSSGTGALGRQIVKNSLVMDRTHEPFKERASERTFNSFWQNHTGPISNPSGSTPITTIY